MRPLMDGELTHVSLFSGIGGIDLAAEAAGFTTICQCEWADYPVSVLEKRWPGVPRFRDIREITKENFIEKTGLETATLLSGGFPCQPFSVAGKRRGFSDERYLWPGMCRVIRELRPRWVLGENVAGFIRMGLDKTLLDLEEAGYATRVFVLPAVAVGAWHERKRVFIVGVHLPHAARGGHEGRCEISGCVYIGDRLCPQEKQERNGMVSETLGGGVLSDPDSHGQLPLDTKTQLTTEGERIGQPVRADSAQGEGVPGGCGSESGLGGMAYGLPSWMDGHSLWEREPDGIPRMTCNKENRAARLAALGNAVVPQQVYPILKYIADIECGRCRDWRPPGRERGETIGMET